MQSPVGWNEDRMKIIELCVDKTTRSFCVIY